jgi:chitodextrinase
MKTTFKHALSKIFFLLTLNLFLIFQVQGQELISRELSEYPSGTQKTPAGCTGAAGNLCGTIEIGTKAKFNKPLYLKIPLLQSVDTAGIISHSENPALTVEIDTFHTCDSVRLLVTGGWNTTVGTTTEHYVEFTYYTKKLLPSAIETQVYRVNLVRDTTKIVMVLDRSGSMDWPVPNKTIRRWDTLEYAVNAFVEKIEFFRKYGDSLGLTYFSYNTMQPSPSNFNKDFIALTHPFMEPTSHTKVSDELSTVIKPVGSTAMGQGLLDAKRKLNQLPTENTKKMVLLVTDGVQNVPPFVSLDGNSLATDAINYGNNYIAGGSNTVDFLNDYSTNPRDSISYYTVATWEAGEEPMILNAIAQNSGGIALNALPYSTFYDLFDEQLENMLYGSSPQIVFKKNANGLSGSVTHSFNLNAHIPTILFHLSKLNIDMSFTKDGVPMDPYIKTVSGSSFNMKSFIFPIITETDTINSEGLWEVTLTGNSSAYYFSAIADDHFLDYSCELDKKIYTVGETIKFNTNISYLGDPVTGPENKVTAFVLKPSDDIGHLLSIIETSLCDTTNDDISNPVSQKYNNLINNDLTFYNALLPDKQEVLLTDVGNGNYTGEFSETDISGPYNILFLINGVIPNNGKFDRYKMLSSIVESDGSDSYIEVFTDIDPPTTPTNLHIENITETSLVLKWEPSTDNYGIDKYIIYQNGVKISEVNYNKCHYSIYHLAPATNYSYYIQARDASGIESENSNNVDIITLGDIDNESPSAPLNLNANNISQTHIYLSWDSSIDNIEVTEYEIYKDEEKLITTSSPNSYVQNLLADTDYTFYVIAKDASGNASESSNIINTKTLDYPDTENPNAPTNLASSDVTQTTLVLNWDIPFDNKGVVEYDIYENNIFLISTNSNQFFRANLAPESMYTYHLIAKDAANNKSISSETIEVSTLGIVDTIAPTEPSNLVASNIAQSNLFLTWDESSDNIGTILYLVYINNELLTTVTETEYSVIDLIPGTEYSIYILAKDAAGNISNSSNVLDVTTLGTPDVEPPTTPENLTATNIGQSTLYLSWDASYDNNCVGKYHIYKDGSLITKASSNSISIVGLSPNTTYSFYVIAEDLVNNLSDNSNEIEVITKEKSDIISSPGRLTATNITQTSFKLNWLASKSSIGGVVYGIFIDGKFIDKTSNTNYTVTGLNPSTYYKAYIIAVDARRNISNPSKTLKVVTLDRFVFVPRDLYEVVGIKIRPKNKFGKYMGPGFKSKIKVECKPQKRKSEVAYKASLNNTTQNNTTLLQEPYLKNIQDNLDGSYYLILGNVPAKSNPEIIITVGDDILYDGKLHQIPWWFYLIVILIIILLIILKKARESNSVKLVRIILTILAAIFFVFYILQTLGIYRLFV